MRLSDKTTKKTTKGQNPKKLIFFKASDVKSMDNCSIRKNPLILVKMGQKTLGRLDQLALKGR